MAETKSVYAKLQEARAQLKNTVLQKTGDNTFAKYKYFELSDFLPTITEVCNKVGICSIINFSNERATLTIYNSEKDSDGKYETILFDSPMGEIEIKGCNGVQNLGGAQTYIRRYLYMNAFEVVENDPSEALTGTDKNTPSKYTKQTAKESAKPKEETVVDAKTDTKSSETSQPKDIPDIRPQVVSLIQALGAKKDPKLNEELQAYTKTIDLGGIKTATEDKLILVKKWIEEKLATMPV